MSHFYTLVLVDKGIERDDIETEIAELMYKYSENVEVEEYDHECYCINTIAGIFAREECRKKFGQFDELRKSYFAKVNALIDPAIKPGTAEFFDAQQEIEKTVKWQDHIAEWQKYEQECTKNHEMYNKPDPDCDECHGTGLYKSTSNPLAKWDWYQIGGRWSGILDNYDPSKDPDNIEDCFICCGTGMRNDALGLEARAKDPAYKCNGCNGEGRRPKWPSELKAYKGDIQPAENVLKLVEQSEENCPFALVTPDGEWHEKGEMGWWACVSNEKEEGDWHRIVTELLKANSNMTAVVVDCHI